MVLLVGAWSVINARVVAADSSPQPALAALQVGGIDAEGLPAGALTVDVDVQNSTRSLLVVASPADPRHVVTVQGTEPGAPRRVTFDPNLSTSPAARTAQLVVTVSGDDTSTRYTVDVLADIGLRLVTADVNPRDWQQPGVDELADRIVVGAEPGAIIVLHDGIDRLDSQTAPALDQALSRLVGSGLRFEPVC